MGLVLFRFTLAGVGLFFAAHQHKLIAMPTVSEIYKTTQHYFRIAAPAIMTQMAMPAGKLFPYSGNGAFLVTKPLHPGLL